MVVSGQHSGVGITCFKAHKGTIAAVSWLLMVTLHSVVVQKVRSTKLGASLPLWSGTFSGVTVTHRRSNKSLEKFSCVFFDGSPLFIPQAASNEPV